MIILIDNSFSKDIEKIDDTEILKSLSLVISNIQKSKKLSDIPNCKKLKGKGRFFRIRLKDYRIGFVFEKNQIELIRFLHRNEVYKYFPK